jgi:hypothetical protein
MYDDEDDEPEIEISYGTDEAIALSDELGLGESDFDDEEEVDATHEDLQLHPADRPVPASQTPGMDLSEADVKDTIVTPAAPSLAEDLPASTLPDLPTPDLPTEPEPLPLEDLPMPPGKALPVPPLGDLPLPPEKDERSAPLEDLPARPATAAPAVTSPNRFETAAPRGDVAVPDVVSDHPSPRPKTLGDLIHAALNVGKKS